MPLPPPLLGLDATPLTYPRLPCATRILSTCGELLGRYPRALSNIDLQLGIYKKGSNFLVPSCGQIKPGSSLNRLYARVVHDDVMCRAEATNASGACSYAYRREMSPRFLSLIV